MSLPLRAGDHGSRVAPFARAVRVVAWVAGLAVALHAGPSFAQGHTTSNPPPVGGNAENFTPPERHLFDRMLCMCGDCARLPLATCTCDFAAATRRSMRERLSQGVAADEIVNAYVARYGAAALSVPPDAGHNRAVWFLPVAALMLGAVGGFWLVRRWRARGMATNATSARVRARAAASAPRTNEAGALLSTTESDYDRRLDEELRGLDD